MKRLQNHLVGVEQGDVVLFSDFESGGPMWTGEGARRVTRPVAFSEAFANVPSVQVALSMWDMAGETNARADVSAENLSEGGVDIVFRTWGDTRVARVRVAWIAIGQLPHEDDWTLY